MRALASIIAAVAALSLAAAARADHASVEVVADQKAVAPGGHVTVALVFKIDPEWHLYWTNPGDTGAPPTVKWTLPPGVKAGPLQFPVPERINADGLTAFGYHDELTLLADIEVSADAKGSIELAGDVQWVVCSDTCIAGGQKVSITIPIGEAKPNAAKQFKAWRAKLPQPADEKVLKATLFKNEKRGVFVITLPKPSGVGPATLVDFFPPAVPFAVFEKVEKVNENNPNEYVYRLPFRILPDAPKTFSGTAIVAMDVNHASKAAYQQKILIEIPSGK